MFGLNENTRYYVCQRYVRMNLGINGLYKIVKSEMELRKRLRIYTLHNSKKQ